MSSLKRGRGRLSFIDQLPDETREDVDWAIEELKARKRPQQDIREEFNRRLLSKGAAPVSASAFNRYSLRLARHWGAMMQVRDAAALFAERLDEEPEGDIGLLLGETIKTLVYAAVSDVEMDGASESFKMLGDAALALQRLERARGTNIATAALKRDKFISQAADAVEKAAAEHGLSKETAADLRRKVLGVRAQVQE
ncbi:MAG: DUF3486 family protein [Parvibaculum sp.]|uniref:phage protein Gp27 family protein n=1 Tax=Parvibaculum sp. TaxID=2024848 RepID=UPI00271E3BC2|nr:phage protein Gp27 family protein [Parvibaculum sp.]MDO8838007.1 DUF3486 family protein [Parvibaculum sp.]